jgi:hypothetical protein
MSDGEGLDDGEDGLVLRRERRLLVARELTRSADRTPLSAEVGVF